ncbi:MAG: hypothetical protein AAFP90_22485 [Planctomycetota bacterium]
MTDSESADALPRSVVIVDRTGDPTADLGLRRFAKSRGMVLGTLFAVTGALGLPLLWWCEDFSPIERYFWAFVNIVYTIVLIAAAGWFVYWVTSTA